jgi:pimeloyl-ACP methyl ester carboxylesterase
VSVGAFSLIAMEKLEPISVIAMAALLMSACAGDAVVSGTASDGEGAANSRDLQPYLSQVVSWSDCDRDWLVEPDWRSEVFSTSVVECATVRVPAIYVDDPRSKDFSLGLMRLRPDSDTELRGSIFINPGGPGGSGIEQVQWSEFPEELSSEFAFIGFDPRGVGVSGFVDGTQIACDDELDFLTHFVEFTPANEQELDEATAVSDAYYESCAADNPLWWTLSTANVVQDLDIMRQVITPGQPLNFIGTSYGTAIAGRYVTEFPESVGKIVLDSPISVSVDSTESDMEWWRANDKKLEQFLDAYADAKGVTSEVAWQRLLEVKQRLDDGEMYGYVGIESLPDFPDAMVSPESSLTWGIIDLTYYPDDLAEEYFVQALDDAYGEYWMGIFEWSAFNAQGYDPDSLGGSSLRAKNIIRSNEFEVRVIVNTMDFAEPWESEEADREYYRLWKEAAPKFHQLFLDASGFEYVGPDKGLSWFSLAFDDPTIPDPPMDPFIPTNTSGVPVLVIGSLYESVTPFSFAKETAERLKSPLISVESEIHGPAAGYDNPCVNEVLVDFFLDRQPVTATTCPG